MSNLATTPVDFKLSRTSAFIRLADVIKVTPEEIVGALRSVVMPGASDADMFALCLVAAETRLNPLKKEIYAFKSRVKVRNKQTGVEQWVDRFMPMIAVDGWITIANRHPDFQGMEFAYADDKDGKPYSCTCTLHVKGRSHPTAITEFFSECQADTEPWRKYPRRMMRWAAAKQGVRVALGFCSVKDRFDEVDLERDADLAPISLPTKANALQARLTAQAAPAPMPFIDLDSGEVMDVTDAGEEPAQAAPVPVVAPVPPKPAATTQAPKASLQMPSASDRKAMNAIVEREFEQCLSEIEFDSDPTRDVQPGEIEAQMKRDQETDDALAEKLRGLLQKRGMDPSVEAVRTSAARWAKANQKSIAEVLKLRIRAAEEGLAARTATAAA